MHKQKSKQTLNHIIQSIILNQTLNSTNPKPYLTHLLVVLISLDRDSLKQNSPQLCFPPVAASEPLPVAPSPLYLVFFLPLKLLKPLCPIC